MHVSMQGRMRALRVSSSHFPSRVRRWRALAGAGALALAATGATGCGARRPAPSARPDPRNRTAGVPSMLDVTGLYRQVGLIAEGAPMPFVGSVAYFAAARPDSTLVLLSLSLSNQGLSFTREGERYRAAYDVAGDVRQGGTLVRRIQGRETVRVASFKETSRADESVVFQQFFTLPVGTFTLALSVRDAESGRIATHESTLTVPRLVDGSLSSAAAVYQASPRGRRDTLPAIIANPRSTAIFGRDSALLFYLEAYGNAVAPLHAVVRGPRGETLWQDSLTLPQLSGAAAGIVAVPLSRILPGVNTLAAWRGAGGDTARAPVVVTFGEGLAVTSFDEMLNYLRYFTTPDRIAALRDTPAAERGTAWLAFLRETDPVPATAEHEALRDYFLRVEQANQRFRDEGPGWLTERGMVYISLGEPDQIYEQGTGDNFGQRGRTQVWQYSQYQAQFVFVDQSGFGRWRLTASSEAEFQSVVRRVRSGQQP